MPFDIKALIEEAEAEVAEENAKRAKTKIKAKLGEISAAKKILINLEHEYATILADISTDA